MKKIQNIIAGKLGIESDEKIDRYNRIAGQDRDRLRAVICRRNRFKDKQRILSNAKN